MKPWQKGYRMAVRHFHSSICPWTGIQKMMEGCQGCEHNKGRVGIFFSTKKCRHPMHPRNIDGLQDYVFEGL
jgi:hypothetical protein